jgi:hypothetical protein
MLTVSIRNTKLGTLRSASFIDSRVIGLYATEHNFKSLIRMSGQNAAMDVLNFLSRREDLLLLERQDL